MYKCVKDFDFASFNDFPNGFWSCSDSVVFFCFPYYCNFISFGPTGYNDIL